MPPVPGIGGNRIFRRPDGHQVEHRMLAICIPARFNKPIFGAPSHREQTRMIIEHPGIIDSFVNLRGIFYDLGIVAKALPHCQYTCKQQCGIDRGKLALPLALAGSPIDEMVEPASLVRHLLRKEAQCLARSLACLSGFHPTPLGSNAKRCQSEPCCGYAGDVSLALIVLGTVSPRAIERQPGPRVRLPPEKPE